MRTALRLEELRRVARTKKKGEGPGTAVRIDGDIVSKCRYLAARAGLELSAYVSGLLRPTVEQEFRKAGRELLKDERETK